MILVTGGAGFIGSNFVHAWLRDHDEPVVNLDKLTYAGNVANLSALDGDTRHVFVRGDIGHRDMVDRVFADHQPRAVINFAAESHVDRSIRAPSGFVDTNVLGTANLLESARQFWTALPDVRQRAFRFLHVSTDEVYGSLEPSDRPTTEASAYRPNSPYAASKASSDHFVRAWHHTYGLPVLTTSSGNNFGPYQFPEKLIPLVICNALEGKPLPMYGDGLQVRDWLYVEDHCRALVRVLDKGRVGGVYNIGGGTQVTNLDLVKQICRALDARRPRKGGAKYADLITFVTDRPGHDRRYALDTSVINTELGWRPTETLETGIEKTVSWYLDHGPWIASVTSGEYRTWIKEHYGA